MCRCLCLNCSRTQASLIPKFSHLQPITQGIKIANAWTIRHFQTDDHWKTLIMTRLFFNGVTVGRDLFTDLVYADDTAFFVDSPTSATTCLSSFADTASVLGLQISWPKTKTQNLGSGLQPDTIFVNGNRVDPVSDFTYLGSSQSFDDQCRPDIRRLYRARFRSNVFPGQHLEG